MSSRSSVQRRDGLRGMIRGLRRGPCESSKQNAYEHKRTTQSKSPAWPLLLQADRLRPRHSLTCSCARARGAFVTPRGKIYLKVVKIVKTRRVAPRSKNSLKWLKCTCFCRGQILLKAVKISAAQKSYPPPMLPILLYGVHVDSPLRQHHLLK